MERPNPTGDNGWLSNKAWASILEMSKNLPEFKGFDTDFEQYIAEWEEIFNSQKPHSLKQAWPAKWQDLNLFRRVVVLSIIRRDKVVPAIEKLIKHEKELGKGYVSPPPFDLS